MSRTHARTLASLFRDNNASLRADVEASRVVSEQRVSEIVKYITGNPNAYIFPAMTASVDTAVRFEPVGENTSVVACGNLIIPISAHLVLLDGLHRCAALRKAVDKDPKFAHECIPLVLFVDAGLRRSDSLFSDLKCHERRTPQSTRVFYDTRDEIASLTRELIPRVPAFAEMIEMAKSTIPFFGLLLRESAN